MRSRSDSAPRRIIATAISRESITPRAANALRRRTPDVDLERAELTEAELRADRRRRVAIGLDDRGLASVGARVIKPALHERGVRAMAPRLWQRRRTTQQHDRRLGDVDEVAPRDGLAVIDRCEVRPRADAALRRDEAHEERIDVRWQAVRARHHVV